MDWPSGRDWQRARNSEYDCEVTLLLVTAREVVAVKKSSSGVAVVMFKFRKLGQI